MTRRLRRAPLALLALSILLLLGLEAAASAAGGSVLQVRVGRTLRCSATLVAPQYVLTARHCVGSGSTGRLRLVAGSGALRVSKAAAVLPAPRARGRRPDLALVQLTSRSALKPVPLGGDYSLPGARKGVTARGWKSTRAYRSAKGKVVRRAAACGRTARRQKLLCARLQRRAASRRCADAAGAALITRRSPVLVGVGTRGKRNCRKRPRATFVPVTTSVRDWVAAQTAPAPSTPPAPGPSPAPTPDPLTTYPGTWQGEVSQDQLGSTRSYLTTIRIESTGPVGQPIGTSQYGGNTAESGCGGNLQLTGNDSGVLRTLEQLTYGQMFCIDGGSVLLTKVNGDDAITYSWTKGPDDGRSTGVLRRIQP